MPVSLNILHLCAGNLFGGIERLLVTLAKHRGQCPEMNPSYALCFDGQLAGELRETGVDVFQLGAARASRPWSVWMARRRLATVLRSGNFDAVIAHACWPHAMFGPVVKAAGLPLIFWCHDIVSGEHWVEKRAARIAPSLIWSNSKVTQASIGTVFPKREVTRLFYPVESTRLGNVRREVRAELSTPENATVIVLASRLERWKGHSLMLEALAKLADEPKWIAWIAGGAQKGTEEEYLAELKSSAEAMGIGERVRFLGHRKDVPRLFAAADIHCQPNTGPEPFGIAFIEAMFAGLPVVTTALGAPLEYVDACSGLLSAPGDAAALGSSLRLLVRDENRRRALGEGAKRRAAEICEPAVAMGKMLESLNGVCVNRAALVGVD